MTDNTPPPPHQQQEPPNTPPCNKIHYTRLDTGKHHPQKTP